MPDFRILPNPVIDSGHYYNEGLGDESPTSFSAGVKGIKEGIKFGLDTSEQALRIKDTYNPERLAAEQYKRDLENKQLQEAIENIAIKNQYEARQQESILKSRDTSTKGQSLENAITEKYGMADKASIISSRNTSTADTAFDLGLKKKYGDLKAKAELFKEIAGSSKKGSGDGNDYLDSSGNLSLEGTGIEGTVHIGGVASADSPIETLRTQLANEVMGLVGQEKKSEILTKKQGASTQALAVGLANRKTSRNISANAVAADTHAQILEASQDTDFEGNPNHKAALPAIAQLNAQHEQTSDPAQKAVIAAHITDGLERMGPDGLRDYVNSLKSDEEKTLARRIINQATVNSGNTKLLSDDQKTAVAAGLSMEHAVDFDGTIEKVNTLISSGTNQIDDPQFKQAMRSSEYVIAARKASKNGTQPYTITADRIQADSTGGPDVTGETSQSQKVIQFIGADGTTANAPTPQTEKEDAELSLIEKASTAHATNLEGKGVANESISQIQQTKQAADKTTPSDFAANPNKQPERSDELTQEDAANALDFKLKHQYGDIAEDDATSLQKLRTLRGLDPISETQATNRTKSLDAQKNKFQTSEQKNIDDATSLVAEEQGRERVMSRMIDLAGKYGTDLFGKKGESFKAYVDRIESVSPNFADLSSDEQKEIYSLNTELEGMDVLNAATHSKYSITKLMDVEREAQKVFAAKGNISNTFESFVAKRDALRVANQANTELSILKNELLSRNIKPTTYNKLVNDYKRNFATEQVVNPNFGKEGEPLFIKNPKGFMSAEEFLQKNPIINQLDRFAHGENRIVHSNFNDLVLPDEPDVAAGSPDAESADVAAQNKKKDNVPVATTGKPNGQSGGGAGPTGSSGLGSTGGTASIPPHDTASLIERAKDFITGIPDAMGVTTAGQKALKEGVAEERSKQDPEFRAIVDDAKKTLQTQEKDSPFFKIHDEFLTKIGSSLTPDFIERWVNRAAAGTVDPVIAATASVFSGKPYQEELRNVRAINQAQAELKEDDAIDNPKTQILADTIGFGIASWVGGTLLKIGASAWSNLTKLTPFLERMAETSPVWARAIKVATGGAWNPAKLETSTGFVAGTAEKTVQGSMAVAGQAGNDALTAEVLSDKVDTEDAGQIAAFSAGIRVLISALGLPVGWAGKKLRGPNDVNTMAKLMVENGVSKEEADALAKAVADDPTGNVYAKLTPAQRGVIQDLADTQPGRDVIGSQKSTMEAGRADAQKQVMTDIDLEGKPSTAETQAAFTKSVDENVAERVGQSKTKYERELQESVHDTIDNVVSGSIKTTEEGIDAITKLTGSKPTKLNISKASGGSDLESVLDKRVAELETVDEALSNHTSPEFKVLEDKHQKLPSGPIAKLNDQFFDKFGKIATDLVGKVYNKLVGTKFEKYLVTDSSSGTPVISPNFKFLSELGQQIAHIDEGAAVQLSAEQRGVMLDMVNRATEEALTKAGEKPGFFQSFIDAYQKITPIREAVGVQKEVLAEVRNELGKESVGSIHSRIFRDSSARARIVKAFGKEEAERLETQLKATDSARTKLDKIEGATDTASRARLDQDISGLTDDMVASAKLTGDNSFFVEKLMKGKPEYVQKIVNGVEGKNKGFAVDGAKRWVRDRLEQNRGKVDVFKDGTTPEKLLGIKKEEWNNLRVILGDDAADVIEKGLQKSVDIDKAVTIFDPSGKVLNEGFGTLDQISIRRGIETRGKIGLDIISKMINKRITDAEARSLMTRLTSGDTSKINKLFTDVANIMERVDAPGGTRTAVKAVKGGVTKEQVAQVIQAYVLSSTTIKTERERERKLNEIRSYLKKSNAAFENSSS